MADVVGAALGWVQPGTALEELNELAFEDGELLLVTDLRELVREERIDVLARSVTLDAEFDHASDLGECEPGCLRGADDRS